MIEKVKEIWNGLPESVRKYAPFVAIVAVGVGLYFFVFKGKKYRS